MNVIRYGDTLVNLDGMVRAYLTGSENGAEWIVVIEFTNQRTALGPYENAEKAQGTLTALAELTEAVKLG